MIQLKPLVTEKAVMLIESQNILSFKTELGTTKEQIKKEVEELLKKTMQLPEQKFLMLYEASLQGPLTHEAFREYMELFKKFWPQAYKGVFGYRTPGQITSACVKQEAKLK